MNFWPFRKPDPLPHVTIRHVVATRQESAKVSAKRLGVELQLAAAIAGMTPDQRKASIARAKTRIRRARDERGGEQEDGFAKAVRLGAWKGLGIGARNG